MPTKKTTKQSVRSVTKVVKKKTHDKHAGAFVAVLSLFVAVSLYSILSFWNSTNDYIRNLYSSVLDTEEEVEVEVEEVVVVDEVREIFKDVYSDHIYSEAIEALYNEGIIKGYDSGDFKPDNLVNRAEFLVVMTNVVDADFGGQVLSNCFTDVKDEWFATFVCYSKNQGWISGYENGSYSPNASITRAEVLKIAFEALDYGPCEEVARVPYEDVSLDDWYAPYACSAKIGGIIPKAGLFNAGSEVTRGELAQIVFNLMGEMEML